MTFEVLISCMNQESTELAKRSNICSDVLIINQCNVDSQLSEQHEGHMWRMISTTERGLAKSRNMALKNSHADLCLIADDDEIFFENTEQLITDAFEKTGADIIAFEIKNYEKHLDNNVRRLSKLMTLKVSSVQIAFKRKSLKDNDLWFDEGLGAGTPLGSGEENKLLWEAVKRGLKVVYVPVTVAELKMDSVSTWFSGYNADFFKKKGVVNRRIMGLGWALIYDCYFAVFKRGLYKGNCRFAQALGGMLKGTIKGAWNE